MSRSAIRTEIAILVVAILAIAVPAHAQRPNQGEDESAALVAEGRAALKRGALDDAAKALDQAIALNPRRVESYVLRSAVYAARKQYKQGIELMRRAEALAPTDEEVLTALGSQLVLSGDTATGVPLLEQVVAKNPARYDAQLLLGLHFHAASRWADSVTALEGYFAHRPKALAGEDARHRVDLADSYLRARQPQKALALFQQAAGEKAKGGDLRARIGIAWATAAIDCRKARPLLRELEPVAETHPEIWLVDGQCAIALGDIAGALALGRKYLDRSPSGTAAGHALVGEAYAARGNFGEARKALETARKLEPSRRRWPVRLAIVLRRAGDLKGALDALDQLGPPDKPATDPDWWSELGETLLAKGDPQTAVQRLSPVVAELPTDQQIRVVLGAAQLQTNQAQAAMQTLAEAETIASSPRGNKLLVDATVIVAVAKLKAEPAEAEAMLANADKIDRAGGTPAVLRNLGIARLQLGKPADAQPVLDRAAKLDPSAPTLLLQARAHALAGDVTGARPIYERAVADRDLAVEVAIDWAASELGGGGDPALAVATLEKVAAQAKGTPLAQRHKQALATARHAAGVAMLRAGNGGKAVELLRASTAGNPTLAAKCDLALAAVVAGDPNVALGALRAVSGQSCPFPPPADTQAAPILIAFTEGLSAKKAGKALDRLTAMSGKSSGPAAVLLGTSVRVVALEAARDAYNSGQLAAARKYLTTARGANVRVGTDEVAHNLAVLDLVEGRVDAAIAQLDKLVTKLPEAYINLGVAYEKKGDQARALDMWRRAKRAGARFAPLNDWIESKERIYGKEAP
ncbi:MAG TPA: tetratricopeptide repeat protein [Kofleriaceae bacterium]|nr:tetratricopeptide repeat protein [Kofleriaceae bacterium]